MAIGSSQRGAAEVRAAMNRVLAAEQEAQAEIARAHDRARQIVRAARDEVRRIEERARHRRAGVHAACERRAQRYAEQLREEAGLVEAGAPSDDREAALVEAACRRLAEILTAGP